MRHPRDYYKHIWYGIKIGIGGLFIILGLASLFLPVLPGIIFLIVGFILIGFKKKWLAKFFKKHHFTRNNSFIKWLMKQ